LGGKNLGRYTPHNVSFGLDANQNQVASLNSITVTGTGAPRWGSGPAPLMVEPALVQIDSTTPFLWLPEIVCSQFEAYLHLVWDSTSNLYLMNDTVHEGLVRLNMTFAFTLASKVGDTKQVKIDVPYEAFDLKIGWPYVNTTEKMKYFPLKRAKDEKMYTLGRAFLQEAYIVTDFDRGNFSVHQAVYPGVDQIVKIINPKDVPKETATDKGKSLSTGAMAGIAVGAGVVVVAALIGIFFWCRRSTKKPVVPGGTPESTSGVNLAELPNSQLPGVLEAYAQKPLVTQSPTVEMAAEDVERTELPAVNMDTAELSGASIERERFSWEATQNHIETPIVHSFNGYTTPNQSRSVSDMSPATPGSPGFS